MWLIILIVPKRTVSLLDTPGEFAYPRELLLRLVLMSVFDGGLSSREIERRTQTDVGYMYLAGMQHPKAISYNFEI